MYKLQLNQLVMFGNVVDFGAAHRDHFPETSLGGRLMAIVASAKLRLEALLASQINGQGTALEKTVWKTKAREVLVDSLEEISRTARAVAIEKPGFDGAFRIPRAATDIVLIATARAFAEHAAPFAATFVEYNLRPSFLDDLAKDIQDFQRAIGEQADGFKARTGATAKIGTTAREGKQAVQRLDAIVRNTFADDAETIRLWESASYVQPVPRKKKTEQPEAEPPEDQPPNPAAAA